jgi:hypothetical protein
MEGQKGPQSASERASRQRGTSRRRMKQHQFWAEAGHQVKALAGHPGKARAGLWWARAVREWDGGLSTECQAELYPQQQACISSTTAPAADEGGTAKAGMPPSKPVREHICVLPDVGVHQKPVPPDHGSGIGHDESGNLCGGRRRCGR